MCVCLIKDGLLFRTRTGQEVGQRSNNGLGCVFPFIHWPDSKLVQILIFSWFPPLSLSLYLSTAHRVWYAFSHFMAEMSCPSPHFRAPCSVSSTTTPYPLKREHKSHTTVISTWPAPVEVAASLSPLFHISLISSFCRPPPPVAPNRWWQCSTVSYSCPVLPIK